MAAVASHTGCLPHSHQHLASIVDKIVLIQHAQSVAQVNPGITGHQPDWKVPLTERGERQAEQLGGKLGKVVKNGKVFFYVSPYERAKQTYHLLRYGLPRGVKVLGAKEEPRLSDQQLGNYQNPNTKAPLSQLRKRYGKFFFRYREGESASDVFGRSSSLLEGLTNELPPTGGLTVVMISHGITIRTLLMKLFNLSVPDFELLSSPGSAHIVTLTKDKNNLFHIDPTSKVLMKFPDSRACPTHGSSCRVGENSLSGE